MKRKFLTLSEVVKSAIELSVKPECEKFKVPLSYQ